MKTTILIAAVALMGPLVGAAGAEEPAKEASAEAKPAEEKPAGGIQFFQGTHAEAVAKAKADGKGVFVFANTKWCGPCRWMAGNVLNDADVGAVFNDRFVSMNMDMEQGEGLALMRTWGIRAYPTLLFFDGSGKEVKRSMNAKKAEELLKLAQEVQTP